MQQPQKKGRRSRWHREQPLLVERGPLLLRQLSPVQGRLKAGGRGSEARLSRILRLLEPCCPPPAILGPAANDSPCPCAAWPVPSLIYLG
ncbi:hypothetical protein P7K49_027391 [Saguinus oedipus]|uniref:Uncharacterized protein n=1 Tax=Saguinus oedipus TaxID=9490 RepID=A0ABQ9UAJ6_SAGOE|nr:hypothetical protein P7K49_027391 [Saguinus oedipus]